MMQPSFSSRSRRAALRAIPAILYATAFAATGVFAITHSQPAWQLALYVALAAALMAIPAISFEAHALDATADWDPDRSATLSCVVFGLGALTLAAMNVVLQRNAFGLDLPSIPWLQAKPDVLLAGLLLAGCVGFSVAASIVGHGLTRDRAIRLRAVDPRALGAVAVVPVRARRLHP